MLSGKHRIRLLSGCRRSENTGRISDDIECLQFASRQYDELSCRMDWNCMPDIL